MNSSKKLSLETLESVYRFVVLGPLSVAVGVLYGAGPLKRKPSFVVSRNEPSNGEEIFENVVMHPSLRKRMEHVARTIANTKAQKVPFRNMMLYGPSGNGKTMVARELARKLGLDYCLIHGGDITPLGTQAWSRVHKIFDSGENTKRGLLILIDDADLFLHKRTSPSMSEAQRSAMNALLFRTSDLSRDTVLVLTTNQPAELDIAVSNRIDDVIEFPLPGEEERFKLLKLYLNKAAKDAQQLNDKVIREAARKTEGFSGREMAILVAAVVVNSQSILDAQLFEAVVDLKLEERKAKV